MARIPCFLRDTGDNRAGAVIHVGKLIAPVLLKDSSLFKSVDHDKTVIFRPAPFGYLVLALWIAALVIYIIDIVKKGK